ERQPQLVSILAPAGTGKTRLLEEFLAQLDPADGFQVAIARCPPYGQTLTYWPLRDMLASLLGGDISMQRVADIFSQGGNSAEDTTRLARLVLGTLGMESEAPPEGPSDREAVFNAWRLLVATLARQVPRIIVFENLDWASDSLLDLVEHLMHPRAAAPLLIVALSRPELLDRRPTWGGGHPNFAALALRPLTDAQTRDLVDQLLEGTPGASSGPIVERSGGNPFFAIELARGLMERADDQHPTGDPALPDTVHAAVLARLDLLAPHERAVLQAAAVAGRAFRPGPLQRVLDGMTPDAITAALDGLMARDLIVPMEGGTYTFRHSLIREVAYGMLSRVERMRLHASIAHVLEAEFADRLDEFAELIAYHYREAVLLVRQSAVAQGMPIDPARAVYFLRRAGELASRSGAFAEARNHLQSAISIATPAEQGQLYELLGDCVLGVYQDIAVDAYRRALKQWRAESTGDPLRGACLQRKLIVAHFRWGASKTDPQEMREMCDSARLLAAAAGDEDEIWRVRVAEVFLSHYHGPLSPEEIEHARAVGKAAAAYFETREDWPAFSEALDMYSSVTMSVGAHAEALAASQRRLQARDLPAAERGDVLNMISRAYFNLGDYEQCIAIVREAVAAVRPGESVVHLSWAVSRAAAAAWYTGRWDELDAFSSAVEDAWEQTQHEPGIAIMWGYFVPLHIALARQFHLAASAAAAALTRGATPARVPGWQRLIAAYLDDDPRQLLDTPSAEWSDATPYPEVLMFLSEREVVAPEPLLRAAGIEARAEQVDIPLHCVRIAEALAAGDDAQLALAVDDAERHGMLPHAARMRVVLARRTGDCAYLDRARPVLEQLGDALFLTRLAEIETCLVPVDATRPASEGDAPLPAKVSSGASGMNGASGGHTTDGGQRQSRR
ncbi:MAG TPA: AAA family ATPase, partial [Ktedonobacterales bacterium]